ncbi:MULTISPECIES: methyltransferase [unclassified Streptomyces]|uniref:methyltransferase n=1 Tax=unclassified Streptomyces TaxID=2593676 RepID=UPI002E0EE312|nr:methyltransferase [Streptomyces sp. NBC_01186]WSS45327.1 methyltransferase [Streptomyces sp. NBC_01187]
MTAREREQAAGEAQEARNRLVHLVFGHMAARTVRAAVEFGIVDIIGVDGEGTAQEIAERCGTLPQPTHRLLRALAGLGLLTETRPGSFTVTPTGALLSEKDENSFGAFVRMFLDPAMLQAWDQLDESIRTGKTAFDTVFGTDFFSYLDKHPDLSARFNSAMSQGTRSITAALPSLYDFARFTTVVDIGGGDGTLLSAVLKGTPALRGVVYDTAGGLAQAKATFEREGVADRATTAVGNFFTAAPRGGDLYLIKSVLHDWNDEQCVRILGHIRDAIPDEGRLLIVEPVMPTTAEAQGAGVPYLSDLNMLVNVGGRERTREDFAELCRAAGFSAPSFTPIGPSGGYFAIEAAPVPAATPGF